MTCEIVAPVSRRIPEDDPRLTAHKMPGTLAHEVILSIVDTADLMQKAIYKGAPDEEVERLREIGRAQFEAYMDLMAHAAIHVRALKP